jgi:hypothetical protein
MGGTRLPLSAELFAVGVFVNWPGTGGTGARVLEVAVSGFGRLWAGDSPDVMLGACAKQEFRTGSNASAASTAPGKQRRWKRGNTIPY